MRHLQEAAEAVRKNLNLPQFDEKAVQALADFIENERSSVPAESREAVVNALGCFLGECIIRSFGAGGVLTRVAPQVCRSDKTSFCILISLSNNSLSGEWLSR
ncbi:hypothetical protein [Hymenobacter volaticus]|uniref:Uncharacterized protein n=1 Tax=Hymenobacter volaticus TaxID=2932254 RepID=A0ABY4G8A0_9BACT|nr:hypothetical protein [Hymenobacter volaticus]UOQ67016.1 hypothetical protein MUN86_03665 [Hymenobacter volaticus]